jgi:glycosyltransferase involved in cell wall biosynthesis
MTMRILAWPGFSNTDNPYNALFYEHLARVSSVTVTDFAPGSLLTGRWDIWHFHWPERLATEGRLVRIYARLLVLSAFVVLAKLSQTKLVWTVHNLVAHTRAHPRLEKAFMNRFVRRVDGAILLTERSRQLALTRYPVLRTKPVAVIPHGHYLDYYPNTTEREDARALLQVDPTAKVLLVVGRISAYKNVVRVIEQFRLIPNSNFTLIVAGESREDELTKQIETAAAQDRRIRLHLENVSDGSLQVFLNAANLVIIPYSNLLNSGTVFLSLSFGRPVLVPRVGSMTELESTFGPEWIRAYTEPLTANVLRTACWDPPASSVDHLVERLRAELGWGAIAEQAAAFFQSVTSAGVVKK